MSQAVRVAAMVRASWVWRLRFMWFIATDAALSMVLVAMGHEKAIADIWRGLDSRDKRRVG